MEVTLDGTFAGKEPRTIARTSALAVPALASIGAGAIHAAAMGVHNEHHQVVIVFALAAAFQLGWGAWALTSTRLWLALVGVVGNGALVVGWLMAKTSGISFIDGFEESESVQWADGAAAALAAVSVIGVVLWLAFGRRLPGGNTTFWSAAFWITAVPIAVITVSAMISASHTHSHGAVGHTHAAGTAPHVDPPGTPAHVHTVAAKPYDPSQPIDLSGTPGVTPKQQAFGENLISASLLDLPHWSDPAVAEAEGWHSIHDGFTGNEHFVNTKLLNDGKMLDSDAPESLVYDVDRATGKRTLAAAMYMLEPGLTLANAPMPAGNLMQWHIHNNLCFTPTTPPRVAGLTDGNGKCTAPLVNGTQAPMVHVWIRPHECGPFAALEGVGGGQIKSGETKLCDSAHGHTH